MCLYYVNSACCLNIPMRISKHYILLFLPTTVSAISLLFSSHVSKIKCKTGNLLWSSWQNKQPKQLYISQLRVKSTGLLLVHQNFGLYFCIKFNISQTLRWIQTCFNYLIILSSHGLQVGTRTLSPPQQVQVLSQCTFTW